MNDPTGFSAEMVRDEANNWTQRETGKEMLLNYAKVLKQQQPDLVAIREVIARVAADNQKSALTLGMEGLRGQCIETAKELHKLARAIGDKP